MDRAARALDRLSALAVLGFPDPNAAIAAILGLARQQLGLSTALIARASRDEWRVSHVDDAAFGFVPGTPLPFRNRVGTSVAGSTGPTGCAIAVAADLGLAPLSPCR